MSNYYELQYCPDCNQMTNHVMDDARSSTKERGPDGQTYRMICQKCLHWRWEPVEKGDK